MANAVATAPLPATKPTSAQCAPAADPDFVAPTTRPPRPGHRRSNSLTTCRAEAHSLLLGGAATDSIQRQVDKWLQANPPKPWDRPLPTFPRGSSASHAAAVSPLPPTDDPAAPERASTMEVHSVVALPPTDDEEEGMDSSATRKRGREQFSSDDEEDGPRKQPVTSPVTLEPSERSDIPEQKGTVPAGHSDGATAVDTPAALPDALSSDEEHMDEVPDASAESSRQEDRRQPTPGTAAAFLKSTTAGDTPAPRKKKKKGKKSARKQHTPAAPAGTSAAISSSGGLRAAPAGPVTTARPLAETPATTSVPASQPEDEVAFQVVKSKAALRRDRRLTAAVLPVNPAVVGTVLYRPAAAGGTFSGIPRLTLARALFPRPGVAAIRVNHRRNIVAADAATQECLEQLLTIKELHGIPVSARKPADRHTSTGFLHGVDGEPTDESLLPGLKSSVPILAATREGRTITVRFASPVPPEHVTLFLVRFPVRPARPRPTQCLQCGRFGHVKESCSWPGACIRCGRAHPELQDCPQARPRCVNCGGPHPANTPDCPRWQEQRRVATIMASSTTLLSRRAVAAAVREEDKEARTFASVLKGRTPPAPPPTSSPAASGNRHRQPPQGLQPLRATAPATLPATSAAPTVTTVAPGMPPAAEGTSAPPPATAAPTAIAAPHTALPAVAVALPAVDPVTQIVSTLLLTLQALGNALPEGHPARAICLQAGALQQQTPHHG